MSMSLVVFFLAKMHCWYSVALTKLTYSHAALSLVIVNCHVIARYTDDAKVVYL